MDFVSPFIGPITSCLWDPLMKQTSYLFKAKSNIKNMTISMHKLSDCCNDLQKEIEDAKREQKQSTNEVKSWLQKVVDIEAQVKEIKAKHEGRGYLLFGDCSLNCWSTYKFGKEAATLRDEMVQLQEKRAHFQSVATQQPPCHNRAIPTEPTRYGLAQNVEMVRNYLSDNGVGVIGIYGMGGVGKTTLLKEIRNSLLGENNMGFEFLIWVVVSKGSQLTTVQAKVAKKLHLQLNDEDDADENAIDISNYLKDKNFLLMLDDIWEGFDIADVGIPNIHCGNNSNNQTERRQKVILTSRFTQVCRSMHAKSLIKVKGLDTPDARSLFQETLGVWYSEENPAIHRLVEEVVDECAGLPLALVVIARAMSARDTIEGWQAAVASLKKLSHDGKLLGEDLHLFSTLRFSYDSLKTDASRKCFLFCSLWPEDYNINKSEIITFCIGIELIKDFDTISEAFDRGHLLIEDLKGACLLESGLDAKNEVKMHDVLRDLAIWIAPDCGVNQNKWLVKAGIGLREVQSEVRKWKGAGAVSLMDNDVVEVSPVPFECPNVAFLMLQRNQYLCKIDPSIFQNMRGLTSLSLRGTRLHELPESIGMLTMLLYLDLSGTRVRSLPKGLENLTRLRYLGLRNMEYLEWIPVGVISSLEQLQLLDMEDTAADAISIRGPEADENNGKQSEEISCKKGTLIDEVEQLPEGLKGFRVRLYYADTFQHLSILSRVFTCYLELQGADLTTIHLKRNMWSNLERLSLSKCYKAKELVFVADEGKINDTCPIKELMICRLEELTEIISRGVVPSVFFQRLQRVMIWGCGSLKNISWILGVRSLVYLSLCYCKGIECLVDDLPGKEDADEALSFLELIDLPDLHCISRHKPQISFPNLEDLQVTDCPNLKKFPFPASNDKLKILCHRTWWNGLEVDESIKKSLKPKFYRES